MWCKYRGWLGFATGGVGSMFEGTRDCSTSKREYIGCLGMFGDEG